MPVWASGHLGRCCCLSPAPCHCSIHPSVSLQPSSHLLWSLLLGARHAQGKVSDLGSSQSSFKERSQNKRAQMLKEAAVDTSPGCSWGKRRGLFLGKASRRGFTEERATELTPEDEWGGEGGRHFE